VAAHDIWLFVLLVFHDEGFNVADKTNPGYPTLPTCLEMHGMVSNQMVAGLHCEKVLAVKKEIGDRTEVFLDSS